MKDRELISFPSTRISQILKYMVLCHSAFQLAIFAVQCNASAVFAMVVCLSLCLSQVGVLLKW